MLGLFLVLRKLSLIGDGLSHVSFGAIALGLFFGFYPFYVAVPVVLIASYFILKLTEKAKMYGDAVRSRFHDCPAGFKHGRIKAKPLLAECRNVIDVDV